MNLKNTKHVLHHLAKRVWAESTAHCKQKSIFLLRQQLSGRNWEASVVHNEGASYITMIEDLKLVLPHENIWIIKCHVKRYIREMPEWTLPGPNEILLKHLFTNIHQSISQSLNECLTVWEMSTWLAKRRTTLVMNDKSNDSGVWNYCPIVY